MYDRIIRAGLWSNTPFVDLADDTQRLLYVFLVERSDDFGCQIAEPRELLRDVCHATQIHTLDHLAHAIEALAKGDLVRPYEYRASADPNEPPLACLFIPKFRSSRSYSKRSAPPSPWCNPAGEEYGPVRQSYGREAFRVQRNGVPLMNRAQQVKAVAPQPQPDQVKASTKRKTVPVQRQPERSPVPDQPQPQRVISADRGENHESPFNQSHDATIERTPGATLAQSNAELAQGEGWNKKEREGQTSDAVRKKGTRIPEGWTIPPEWVDWAIGNALDQGCHVARPTVMRISLRFYDYYLSKAGPDATSMNWLARWRSWWAREDLPKLANQRTEQQPDAISRAR